MSMSNPTQRIHVPAYMPSADEDTDAHDPHKLLVSPGMTALVYDEGWDPELGVMAACVALLDTLPAEARTRVVEWLEARDTGQRAEEVSRLFRGGLFPGTPS